jgi:DNA-binding NarL/FixJ family response regulator
MDFAKWEKLNADSGGKLEERVLEIRLDPCKLTRIEAIIVVFAELGKDCMTTADLLGIEEHTVENHRSDIRKKKKAPRNQKFDMLFR